MRLSVNITLDDLASAICQKDRASVVELILRIDEIMDDPSFTAELFENFRLVKEEDDAEALTDQQREKAAKLYGIV
jgi:hypothetical protein